MINDAIMAAGFGFMSGANGRPGIYYKRTRAGGGSVLVIRVSGDGYTLTRYPRESYPDGGTVIAGPADAESIVNVANGYCDGVSRAN